MTKRHKYLSLTVTVTEFLEDPQASLEGVDGFLVLSSGVECHTQIT